MVPWEYLPSLPSRLRLRVNQLVPFPVPRHLFTRLPCGDAPGGRRCPRDISSPWRDRCSTANRAVCVGSGVGVALVASGVRKDLASQAANSGTVAGAAVLVERFLCGLS
jgi:hypothetical protein